MKKISIFTGCDGRSMLAPFVLVASLFFLWGFAHSILDVLNKHFQEVLVVSKARSALVQTAVYGGYFLMALPAGAIIRRKGYRSGVVLGLLLYGIGAMLFILGAELMSFPFFLLCLLIIGCGLTCLETSANPYVTVLGRPEGAASRLNLAQSLNGLGQMAGPMAGGLLILGKDSGIALPYAAVGGVALALALVFSRVKLPEVSEDWSGAAAVADGKSAHVSIWRRASFVFGVVALFFYVAAQTGINSFFINYVTENDPMMSPRTAAVLLSLGGMGLFFIGRLLGSAVMRRVRPPLLVLPAALSAIVCMVLVIAGKGKISVAALSATYLFESIMFPTIFSMAVAGIAGQEKKTASSVLIMSIVGGAVAPVLMGFLGERSMAAGFTVPLACFVVIAAYAFWYLRDADRTRPRIR